MGPEVAVLDHSTGYLTFAIDSSPEYRTMPDNPLTDNASGLTIADALAMVEQLKPLAAAMPALLALANPSPQTPPVDDAAPPPADTDMPAEDMDPNKMAAMDSRIKALDAKLAAIKPIDEASLRKTVAMDAAAGASLANRMTPIVGVFDHAGMTHAEVAAYGLDKIGLTAPVGAEAAVLDAYLKGRAAAASTATVAADARPRSGGMVESYVNTKPE
jgi:hypothetical protein